MEKQRYIVTVLGKAGAGKTHLVRETILPVAARPVFIIDPMAEFSTLGLQFEDPGDLWRYVSEGRPNASGIYTMRCTRDHHAEEVFRLLSTAQEPATLLVDEASNYCSPHSIDDELKRIVAYGRHWGQNVILTARRPAEIHRDLTAQSDAVITFQQTEARDLKALSSISDEAARASDLTYEKHEYLVLGRWQHLPFADALEMGPMHVHETVEDE